MVAGLVGFISCLIFGYPIIYILKRMQIGQIIQEDGPQSHLSKAGTPTMGGLVFLVSLAMSLIVIHIQLTWEVQLLLLATFGFGAIGCVDDVLKLFKKQNLGLKSRGKYFLQSILALILSWMLYHHMHQLPLQLSIPFSRASLQHLGLSMLILSYFVLVGSSNAVNLTDGLDGLAMLVALVVLGVFVVFSYVAENQHMAQALALPFISHGGSVLIFCAALLGSGLGFLWFNTYPAHAFMGDVGSLALGGALGMISILLSQELLLAFVGGIFVIETLSVIIQVISFKLTRKRVFKMAPLHHHFELSGWPEPKVVARFLIITICLAGVALASLYFR